MSVFVGDFLCVELLADYLLIRLHCVFVWEYENILSTKHFVISSKITALCSRNRSAVLTYLYIHTLTSRCLLESEDDSHVYTHPYKPFISRANPHIHLKALLSLAFPRALLLHSQTSS